MLNTDLVSVLCCPICPSQELSPNTESRTGDRIEEGQLLCSACGVSYPVHQGVPDLIPHDILTTGEWQLWEDHLEGLQARREQRRRKKAFPQTDQSGKPPGALVTFSEFAQITEGAVLDVGCGPGKIRLLLDASKVTYYGIDPLPLPETKDFYFARALAEHIPFKDNTFSDVIVLASLDHFVHLDRFFDEVTRVLRPNGRFHLSQSIHQVTGPVTAVKMLGHFVKDTLERRATTIKNPEAPKHMSEFTKSSLFSTLGRFFEIESQKWYSRKWYAPTNLLLSMRVKPVCSLADSR